MASLGSTAKRTPSSARKPASPRGVKEGKREGVAPAWSARAPPAHTAAASFAAGATPRVARAAASYTESTRTVPTGAPVSAASAQRSPHATAVLFSAVLFSAVVPPARDDCCSSTKE